MKSTLIIVFFPYFARKRLTLQGFSSLLLYALKMRIFVIQSRIKQDFATVSSNIGSKTKKVTTKVFALDLEVSQSSVEKHS